MNKQLPLPLLIIITALLAVVVIGQYRDALHDETVSKHAYVYQVCNASRISPTISEGECGDAQDKTNTEFLCTQGNQDPDNYCWVEDK